ncbi:MAG TPA: hypothetical protein DIW86_22440 [Pseudomonas sp.]|nr:hypothetical protein [Pseudomonas sp.]
MVRSLATACGLALCPLYCSVSGVGEIHDEAKKPIQSRVFDTSPIPRAVQMDAIEDLPRML